MNSNCELSEKVGRPGNDTVVAPGVLSGSRVVLEPIKSTGGKKNDDDNLYD